MEAGGQEAAGQEKMSSLYDGKEGSWRGCREYGEVGGGETGRGGEVRVRERREKSRREKSARERESIAKGAVVFEEVKKDHNGYD